MLLKERGIISPGYKITDYALLQENTASSQNQEGGLPGTYTGIQAAWASHHHIHGHSGKNTAARRTHRTTGHNTRRGWYHRQHRHGSACVGVKLTGTETGGAIINRDRRKWEGSLKGVHVTTHTA